MDREMIADLIHYAETKKTYQTMLPEEILTFWDACEAVIEIPSSVIAIEDRLSVMKDILNLVIWHRCKELGYSLSDDLENKLRIELHEDIQPEDYMIDELSKEYWDCLTDAEKEKVIKRSRKQKDWILENPYFWKELSDEQREIIGSFAEEGGMEA